uniref:Late embryogenesis abundant protein LEA-2 subgroup domain-containing protein n=1 Tax=Ananas comosus var. bracteatus TaxID=296719 RepID=A0A6V7QUU5_ANACO
MRRRAAAAAVAIIIIALTVYKVREPVMTMNSVAVRNLDLQASSSAGILAANITVAADVSVKNPNAATFELGPSATAVYYRGRAVARRGPAGTRWRGGRCG